MLAYPFLENYRQEKNSEIFVKQISPLLLDCNYTCLLGLFKYCTIIHQMVLSKSVGLRRMHMKK